MWLSKGGIVKRLIVGLLVLAVLGLAACGGKENKAVVAAQNSINSQLALLSRVEPIPRLLDSADRLIQNYVYTAEADPNKIWYLETLSMTGSVEATYTIRGPVESTNDQVTNPSQLTCSGNNGEGCGTIGLAEPNGVYVGPSNDHVAILTSGAILRFEGQYQTSDQPFTVKTATTIAIDGSRPITPTDLSKTVGGKRPRVSP